MAVGIVDIKCFFTTKLRNNRVAIHNFLKARASKVCYVSNGQWFGVDVDVRRAHSNVKCPTIMNSDIKLNITIIIFTHNRHKLLTRSLNYYKNFGGKLIVADSSNLAFAAEVPKNTKYLHLPGMGTGQKINAALKHSKSKYSILSSDDDFLSFEGLKSGEIFLDRNEDYASVQGTYINFDSRHPDFLYGPMYEHFRGCQNLHACAQERLKFAFYVNNIYALMPTSVMTRVLSLLLIDEIQAEIETVANLGCAALGKGMILPSFWMARDTGIYYNAKSSDFQVVDWRSFLDTDNGGNFVKKLQAFSGTDLAECSFDVSSMMAALDNRDGLILKQKESVTNLATLKRRYMKMLPAFLVLTIRAFTCWRRRRREKHSGYPWTDTVARDDWAAMRVCIQWANKT